MVKSVLRRFDRRVIRGTLGLLKRAAQSGAFRRAQHIYEMSRRPVFVGGCGRSGTTLVLSLLSAHPDLYAILYETQAFTPGPYPPEEDTGRPFEFFRAYTALMNAPESVETYQRWCEKTPGNIHYAERILDYFGKGARFIHVVRDGRAVVTSRHQYHAPNQYWVTPERWVRDVEAGRRVEEHPQVLTVRYEDIITDHMAVMHSICNFLGEPFAQEAFENYPETAKTLKERNGEDKPPRPIRATSQGRWKEEEHEERVAKLLSIPKARDHLTHYGYQDAPHDAEEVRVR